MSRFIEFVGLTPQRALLALASIALLSIIISWQAAIIVFVFVCFHESGHLWAAEKCGLKSGGITFLPIGGVASIEGKAKTEFHNAFIAIMGPIWGLGLTLLALILYLFTKIPVIAVVAFWMSIVNLFNLLPLYPTDGGRLVASMFFSIHKIVGLTYIGILICVLFVIVWITNSPLFLFLMFLNMLELARLDRANSWSQHNLNNFPDKIGWMQILITCIATITVCASYVAIVIYAMKMCPNFETQLGNFFHYDPSSTPAAQPTNWITIGYSITMKCLAIFVILNLVRHFIQNRNELKLLNYLRSGHPEAYETAIKRMADTNL